MDRGGPGTLFAEAVRELLFAAVVLGAMDAAGLGVLLVVQRAAVLRGEVAVVPRAHAALFAIDAALLMLEACGFAGGELAALDTLRDAVLLVLLALVDGWIRMARRRLRKDGSGGECEGSSESNAGKFHGVSPFRAAAWIVLPARSEE